MYLYVYYMYVYARAYIMYIVHHGMQERDPCVFDNETMSPQGFRKFVLNVDNNI